MKTTVYFATNRMPLTSDEGDQISGFGPDLGPIDGTSVRFGSAEVEIRKSQSHFDGSMVPGSLYVAKEQLYGRRIVVGSRDIFEKLRTDMMAGGLRPTLVIIHGFSNNFSDAIERAATVAAFYREKYVESGGAEDMNVFSFTWPSRSTFGQVPLPYGDYIHDRETARASGIAMARTLQILYDYIDSLKPAEVCRQPLHLVCHSMGNYAFRHCLQALMRLPPRPQLSAKDTVGDGSGLPPVPPLVAIPMDTADPNRLRRTFDQIILAAADEDEDAFDQADELKYLARLGNAVTIYHNRKDWVLSTLSHYTKFNGPRLGVEGPDNMSTISDKVVAVDVRDASGGEEDVQQHQYYRLIPAVRDDIVEVLKGTRPNLVPNREALSAQRYRITPKPRRKRTA